MRALVLLLLQLSVLCAPLFVFAASPPRVHSTVPVYRPTVAYHTYEGFKDALAAVLSSPRHKHSLRMQASKDKTFDGEYLYLAQLGHWHKDDAGMPLPRPAATDAPDGGGPRVFLPPSTPRDPARKLRVLLTFGEHAREHITVESFLHLLHSLLEGVAASREDCAVLGSDIELDLSPGAPPEAAQRSDGARLAASAGYRARFASFVLDHAEVHLLGCTNPDGKMYLERTKDYCWRNTGRNVDLNRNADWQFGGPGSSTNPRAEEYHGAAPFSETETRFVRDLVREYRYDAFVSVHSGEQQLFVPFVDTESRRMRRTRPETAAELAICERVVSHPHLGGWLHDSGLGFEQNDYAADGTLFDYFAGVEQVPRVFCVELYGGPTHDDCFVQFNPDAQPKPVVHSGSSINGAARVDPRTGQSLMTSALEESLARMHVFYVRMLSELIAEHYGLRVPGGYVDPAEILDAPTRRAALDRARRVCEVERELYAHKARLVPQDTGN